VIYTLIALTVIGIFLSFARPKIEEIQDKSLVEQSAEMLEDIEGVIINVVQGGAGNQRVVDLGIKKGTLTINGTGDTITFETESRYTYSEPGEIIQIKSITATTEKHGNTNTVTLISNYSNYNITYNGGDEIKVVGKSPSPFKILIANKGATGGKNQIDFKLI